MRHKTIFWKKGLVHRMFSTTSRNEHHRKDIFPGLMYSDGENIEEIIENNDGVSLSDDNQILDFKFAKNKYEGKYECNVENRVGHIQPFTNVIIEGEALGFSDPKLCL
ncbi:hypothetical protein Anas_12672 [Armadillidium nasatum]|uniref:Immunoglobulin I-set domain-containing protein n=1 Tax=Armadillidium nasatum TaxID=96803 RepID=A0A5N5T6U3_9CRUS|nr:hypothetical protein Anas_12672 [Armadillidium nasatum]